MELYNFCSVIFHLILLLPLYKLPNSSIKETLIMNPMYICNMYIYMLILLCDTQDYIHTFPCPITLHICQYFKVNTTNSISRDIIFKGC